LFLTALNVKYRDFRYVIPFIVQFGLFISPVGFSSDVIPQNWRLLYSLNPIVGVIDGFRWAICRGQSQIYVPGLVLSALVIVFFLWLGVWYFRKTEKGFADVI
jgi:lipopolysaccharide transport system permease protein